MRGSLRLYSVGPFGCKPMDDSNSLEKKSGPIFGLKGLRPDEPFCGQTNMNRVYG